MQYFRLQLGCLMVILYVIVTYHKAAVQSRIPRNHLFDALMIVTPWAVFFDGLTAWTVNHPDIVSAPVNGLAHLFFFVTMDLVIIITTLYMYDETIGLSKRDKNKNLWLLVPGAIF